MNRTILGALCLLISSALTSCAGRPVVDEFTVTPNLVCQGDPVSVRWRTRNGGATLHVEPQGRSRLSSSVADSDSTEIHIFEPTTITLEVRSNQSIDTPPDSRSATAGLFQLAASEVITVRLPCQSTPNITINEILTVRPPSLRVTSVGPNRLMTVSHESRAASLGPSAPSDVFRDTPMNGPWNMTTPIFMDERCCVTGGVSCGREILSMLNVTGVCPELMPGGSSQTPPPVPAEGVGLPRDWRPCGLEGGGCCSGGQCGAGLTCFSFQCQRGNAPGPVTCSGAPRDANYQVYPFGYKDPWGCSVPGSIGPFGANSLEEAQQCAANYGQQIGASPVYPPVSHNIAFRRRLRGEGCHTVYPSVYDMGDAEACARHLWCEPPNDCEVLERGVCGGS